MLSAGLSHCMCLTQCHADGQYHVHKWTSRSLRVREANCSSSGQWWGNHPIYVKTWPGESSAAFPSFFSPSFEGFWALSGMSIEFLPLTMLVLTHPQEASWRRQEMPEGIWHGEPRPVVHGLPLEKGLPALPGLRDLRDSSNPVIATVQVTPPSLPTAAFGKALFLLNKTHLKPRKTLPGTLVELQQKISHTVTGLFRVPPRAAITNFLCVWKGKSICFTMCLSVKTVDFCSNGINNAHFA